MMLRVTEAVHGVTLEHFKSMLLSGAFPKVNYKQEGGRVSYSMFDYSNTYARMMKLVNEKMEKELDPELGVFTRKRSKKFLEELAKLVSTITPEEVENYGSRYRSFADAVMEEAMK